MKWILLLGCFVLMGGFGLLLYNYIWQGILITGVGTILVWVHPLRKEIREEVIKELKNEKKYSEGKEKRK